MTHVYRKNFLEGSCTIRIRYWIPMGLPVQGVDVRKIRGHLCDIPPEGVNKIFVTNHRRITPAGVHNDFPQPQIRVQVCSHMQRRNETPVLPVTHHHNSTTLNPTIPRCPRLNRRHHLNHPISNLPRQILLKKQGTPNNHLRRLPISRLNRQSQTSPTHLIRNLISHKPNLPQPQTPTQPNHTRPILSPQTAATPNPYYHHKTRDPTQPPPDPHTPDTNTNPHQHINTKPTKPTKHAKTCKNMSTQVGGCQQLLCVGFGARELNNAYVCSVWVDGRFWCERLFDDRTFVRCERLFGCCWSMWMIPILLRSYDDIGYSLDRSAAMGDGRDAPRSGRPIQEMTICGITCATRRGLSCA